MQMQLHGQEVLMQPIAILLAEPLTIVSNNYVQLHS